MAPPSGSGCVNFKTTVVEESGLWSMDKGRLSLTLCEEKVAEHSDLDDINEPCCACEEAKYEVTFEGLCADYRFWEYGGYASKGLEQVAKWGSPRILESELKAESDHIRTIIKARGLWYPNHEGKTFAVFRTDKKNHLVSLVSMMGPSPDWIVGVSGLELCRKNYSGISYESPDSPTEPKLPITRISSRFPNDPRQPFYDDAGVLMKPLAKLILNRQRLYKKSCSDEDFLPEDESMHFESGVSKEEEQGVEEDESIPGCQVSEWSDWSTCSVTCGKGLSMRTRDFLIPGKASMMGCDRQLVQKEMCSSEVPKCEGSSGFYANAPGDFLPDDMCATSEWTKWSECSTTCGKGFRSRTRRFFNRMGRKKCPHIDTIEKLMCAGNTADCSLDNEVENPICAVTTWSDWSPCSVSCGKGLKIRTRLYIRADEQEKNENACDSRLMEKGECEGSRSECKFDPLDAKFICGLSKEVGPCRGYFPRWYFDSKAQTCTQFVYGGCRGNSNNFNRFEECDRICKSLNNSTSAGHSFIIDMKKKQMMVEQQRKELVMKQHEMMKTEIMMLNKKKDMQKEMKNMQNDEGISRSDCSVTSWSPWSQCNASCGKGFRRKFRTILVQSSSHGKKCPKKLEKKQKCDLPPCQNKCMVGSWSDWSTCSGWCGIDGSQERSRIVLETDNPSICPPLKEERFCTTPDC
ncbi:unnamed protein product [Lepeophtheirus salmonis]|uniref:Spondin-1 n=1 Tax=Lepeophtheirus salmonis TaxID=72036 RepID=A0A7R8H3W3_LEPSM|nr:unnamed protein product [Lepeophtheirus salmonis]CAF2840564.1 unnamed protein product [Lepeophtheirus salmonis]